jgi:carboxypeptidase C (cathepsin A)
LNGIILISPVLDFDTIIFHPSNDLPYLLFLPTYSATAWHYKLLPASLQKRELSDLLDEVESFCLNDYSVLLAKGEDVNKEERKALLEKLSFYTNLSGTIIQENNFRIDWVDFTKNLLKEEKKLVGRMDSTIAGIQVDPSHPYPQYDPSLETIFGPFSSAMNHYVREDLEYESELIYEFLNSDINRDWDWSSGLVGRQGFIDVSHNLREALAINDNLKVFIASGYYDLATPYFATKYTLNHLWLGEQRSNITTKNYDSGHMIYTHLEEHKKLFQDVKAFYEEPLNF